MRSWKMQAAVVAALGLAGLGLNTGTSGAKPVANGARVQAISRSLSSHGIVNVRALGLRRVAHVTAPASQRYELPPTSDAEKAVGRTAVPVPNPVSTTVSGSKGGASGFVGITDLEQRLADNGNQFNLEPPDQGLCAHGGVIVEAVNNGLQIFTNTHTALTPVISMSRFLHLPSEIDRSFNPPTFGPFLSDPRCYYDPQTARWFVTELQIDRNPLTGALAFRSAEYIAVSQTSDPTGNYRVFAFDTTNDGSDGTPSEANCPCLGDQPRIGADAHGFYISTDSYSIANSAANSNGGELYALSKQGLAAAAAGSTAPVTFVSIHLGALTFGGFPANAVQPATTPEGARYAVNTAYFMSTPDFNGFATSGGQGAQAVLVWALRNTASLDAATPALTLNVVQTPSETYAPLIPARQRPGPTPLATSVNAGLPRISVNDDRMQQVEYVQGHLYSSLNTGIGTTATANRSGIAWFQVRPTLSPTGLTALVSHQGYLAASSGASLMYPAIGLTAAAEGAMAFSISGPTHYPSAAFIRINAAGVTGTIHIAAPGAAPEDGFTCYKAEGFGPTCRWGDYSAASSDGAGNIVFGTEMIPNTPRTAVANWGTFIGLLRP